MQNFESDDKQEVQVEKEKSRNQEYPVRASGEYAPVENPWPRITDKEERDIAGATKRKPFTHRQQGNRWDQYGESSSAASSASRVTMYIRSLRGDLVSLWVETREQLNPTDFRRPIEVIVSGPDGQVTSDSHSRITGVNLQGGNRLPATTAPGRKCLNGKDHNGLPQLERP